MALKGDLKYLNINTTFNTTIKQNYRQMESAFWSEYLPTVIGIIVPTYPPTTEVSNSFFNLLVYYMIIIYSINYSFGGNLKLQFKWHCGVYPVLI